MAYSHSLVPLHRDCGTVVGIGRAPVEEYGSVGIFTHALEVCVEAGGAL